MPSTHRRSRRAGFTLVELLVVLAILTIAMGLGIPALQNFIIRSRTEGLARETATLLQRGRLESIRANRPVAARIDSATGELVAFVDANANGVFDPDPKKPYRTADFVLGRVSPTDRVRFEDPAGKAGNAAIDGFTVHAVGGATERWAVFRPDGSVSDEGAFRIADVRGNALEIRIEPAATGRVEVRKWSPDDKQWYGAGDPSAKDFKPWKWQ